MPKRNRSKKNVLKNISDASLKKLIELKKKLLKGGEGEGEDQNKVEEQPPAEPSVLNKIAEGFKGLFSGTNTTDANAAGTNAAGTNNTATNNTATSTTANTGATTGATTGGKSRRRNHNNNNKRNNSKRNRKQNSKKRN